MFQSLEGILLGFNKDPGGSQIVIDTQFQSLEGILLGFNFAVIHLPLYVFRFVSIP